MRQAKISNKLNEFVKGVKDSYRSKDGGVAKVPTDLLALSITLELKRLERLYGTEPRT